MGVDSREGAARAMLSLPFPVLLLLLRLPSALSWGHDGHLYICAIAQGLLTDEASAHVNALLPDWAEGYMPNVCSWADYIGHTSKKWRWSLPLHYVDTPDNACTYDFARDCHAKCCVAAILNYTSQLTKAHPDITLQAGAPSETIPADKIKHLQGSIRAQGQPIQAATAPLAASSAPLVNTDKQLFSRMGPSAAEEMLRTLVLKGATPDPDPAVLDPTVALMFLVHFVGDIHQPLHVGFTSDYGGNTIHIHWYKKKTNLHEVWDTEIIKHGVWKYYGNKPLNFTLSLANRLSGEWAASIESWVTCDQAVVCPNAFARESIKAACKWAYSGVKTGDVLEDPYFETRFPVVEIELAKAGVRLAATLNRIFSSAADHSLL